MFPLLLSSMSWAQPRVAIEQKSLAACQLNLWGDGLGLQGVEKRRVIQRLTYQHVSDIY